MGLLKIKNLHAAIDGKEILKGIDLEVNAGEVHAIMGPNGAPRKCKWFRRLHRNAGRSCSE